MSAASVSDQLPGSLPDNGSVGSIEKPFDFWITDYGIPPYTGAALEKTISFYGLGHTGMAQKTLKSHNGKMMSVIAEWDYTYYGIPPGAVIGDGTVRDNKFCYGTAEGCFTSGPANPVEAYNRLKGYFDSHQPVRTAGDELVSITGHYWFQHYGAQWGADIVGTENGAGTGNYQSHLSFSRGAAVQYGKAWMMDWSTWYGTSARGQVPGSDVFCLTCGHSNSLAERFYYLSWFGGADYINDEGSSLAFFTTDPPDANGYLKLSAAGEVVREFMSFQKKTPRGKAFVPIAVVINRYHGIGHNWAEGQTWDYLPFTEADRATYNLFNQVMWPNGFARVYPIDETQDMVNMPHGFGEGIDVLTEDASAEVLAKYPILILSGDIDPSTFTPKARQYLSAPNRHVVLNLNLTGMLADLSGGVGRVYAPGTFSTLVAHVNEAYRTVAPFTVTGNLSYQMSRLDSGEWMVSLTNNLGVNKPISSSQTEAVNPAAAVSAVLNPNGKAFKKVEGLRGPTPGLSGGSIQVTVPPGKVVLFKITL